jgi:cytochrome c oxidase cbb3-type subunit III
MKYGFFWIAMLGIGIGLGVWAAAPHHGGLYGTGSMLRAVTMGGTAYAAQGPGQAASNYANLCVSCHGANGNGKGPAAAALNPKPRDFADCKVMAKIPDDTLFKTIRGGGQTVGLSPMMPSWSGSLSDPQIHDMVKYIRGFCKK